jgi:predicted nuclease with TOPRIM domain
VDAAQVRAGLVGRVRSVVTRGPVMRARQLAGRVVTPEVALLRDEVTELRDALARQGDELAGLRADLGRAETERERLADRVGTLDADLDEARRLNVRLAELTDLVTEVVLPLHDREIDIERLRPHDVEPQ